MDKNNKIKKKVSVALKDETNAIRLYNNMIKICTNDNIKAMLIEIRNDEIDHHRKLMIIRDMIR